jgi:hypothetical protein
MIYGGSDYTAPHRHASGRSLNYVSGGSITKPELEKISVTPYSLNYKDSVGLFGAENHFVKIDLRVTGDVVFQCYEGDGWQCAEISNQISEEIYWEMGEVDAFHNVPIDPDGYYQAALSANRLPNLDGKRGYFSVELINNKTGNKYNDDWLDVRLYTRGREEHPYDKMYVRQYDQFYIGFHARNTRRLPYDVECIIGVEWKSYDDIAEKQYIMKR